VLFVGGVAACSDENTASSSNASASPVPKVTFAEPAVAGAQPPAITYNPALAPTNARETVLLDSDDDSTTVELRVDGLVPGRRYGAHVHTKPCGPKPADAGPHYQNQQDPVTPSTDPKYANPRNEFWLDFVTDAKGAATSKSTVDWEVRPGGANAVVIHQRHTATHPGEAGVAGDRLACITVKF